MQELLTTLALGGTVALVGGLLMWGHRREWAAQRVDAALSERERGFYARRYRRRMQTSGLLLLIGVALCFATAQIRWSPLAFTIYVAALLFAVVWLVILAVGDMAANRLHNLSELAKLRVEQQRLEASLRELKKHPKPEPRRTANGPAPYPTDGDPLRN